MENTLNVSVTSVQLLLALLFQMWLVIFPIIIIIKLNRLTKRFEDRFGSDEEEPHV